MKRKRFLIILVVIMFIMQVFSGITSFITVKAAEITNFPFITDVSIKDKDGNALDNNVSKNSEIHINYTWSIPNDKEVNAGDFYQMQLPNQINIAVDVEQAINDNTGNKIADMHIGTNGIVKITFSQYASEHSNVHGSFSVDCHFKDSEIGNLNPVSISFVIPGIANPVTVDVNFQQPDPTVVKEGSYNSLTDEITWTVTANKEGVKIDNASVNDTINAGQIFVDNSVTINGNIAEIGTNYNFDTDNNKLNVKLGNITSKQIITFKTSVHDNLAAKSQGTYSYSNTALLKYEDNGNPKSITSNTKNIPINVKYISKDGSYDASTKRINWTIKVNESARTIDNAVVKDAIPAGLTLIDGTVQVNGQAKTKDVDYLISGQNFTYNLGNINSLQTINFATAVDINVYNSNNNKSYTNVGTLTGNNVPAGTSASKVVGFTPNIIQKVGAGYDASTGIISWRITVNNNKTSVAAGAVVTDNIPIGQTYVDGSANLDDNPIKDIVYTAASNGDTTKTGIFKYTFPSAFSDTHIITFKTQVTDSKVYKANYIGTYYNSANLTAAGINQDTTGAQNVSSQVINKTGINYNYVTRETTWKIVVNKNKMPITNAVVTDYIPIGQEYVDNSATIDNGAAANGFNYTAVIGDSVKTGTLTYTFPQGKGNTINNIYTITFRTRLLDLNIFNTNGDKVLNNTASITGDELPTDGNRASLGSQIIKNSVIDKISKYIYGASYIDWTIKTNSNFSIPLSGATITDTLQEGLSLDTDTVELYKMTVNPDGSLTQGDKVTLNSNNVKYNTDNREFIFAFPENSGTGGFMLKFRTYANKTATYTNLAEFKMNTVKQSSASNPVGVWYSTGGGSGTGEFGSITVVKVDSSDVTKKLSGAVFQLLDQYGNVKSTSLPTGQDGTVIFDKIKYDINYSVKEITPPAKYNLSNEVYTFQIHNTSNQKNIIYNYEDTKIKGNIEFTKVGEDGSGLKGAIFTLYKDDGITPVTDSQGKNITATSGTDGKVKFTNVEYGNYKIKETFAPEGYNFSSEVLSASFSGNYQNTTITVTPNIISNTKIYGGIIITKTDSLTSKPLPGATITVYTSDGKPVGGGVQGITEADGTVKFDSLSYGDYYFLETKAPKGYLINEDKHPFSIKENGTIIQDTISDAIITGGIKIAKKDFSTANPVSGATITVYTSDGKPIGGGLQGITEADGTVKFDNLPYGDYYFLETKAPKGYLINEDKHPFSIKENGVILNDTFTDAKIKGTVKIMKKGEDGNYLGDTEFTLFDANGKVVQKAATDDSGLAKFTDVEYGDYYVKETKAPKGYTISDKEFPVQINENEDGKTYDAGTSIDSKIKATIVVNKLDQDGKPLEGAEFNLYDKAGKAISTALSDKNGIAKFEAVDYGFYSIKETKAPKGYKMNDKELKVQIDSLKTQTFTVQDEKIVLYIPKTGGFLDTTVLMIIGSLAIFLGTGLIFKRKN